MSINLSYWMGDNNDIAPTPTDIEALRAAAAWHRIQDKPSSIAFKPVSGATLSAQTIRVESDSNASPSVSAAGAAPRRRVVIFGIRNHATLANTNLAEGYRFVYLNDEYRIVDIILTLGEIQGIAEAIG
jgi:hypothetical protein